MTLALDLVKIPVTDISRAVPFYEAALGVEASFVSEPFGWAQFGGLAFNLALYVPGRGGGVGTVGGDVGFHLSHNELTALRDQVSKVAQDAAIHDNADGSRSLEFSDLDGNVLKIMERYSNIT